LELTNNNAATSDKTPPAQNVLSLLKLRAEKQASGIAVTLLDAKGREAKSWTYEKMAIKVLSLVYVLFSLRLQIELFTSYRLDSSSIRKVCRREI